MADTYDSDGGLRKTEMGSTAPKQLKHAVRVHEHQETWGEGTLYPMIQAPVFTRPTTFEVSRFEANTNRLGARAHTSGEEYYNRLLALPDVFIRQVYIQLMAYRRPECKVFNDTRREQVVKEHGNKRRQHNNDEKNQPKQV